MKKEFKDLCRRILDTYGVSAQVDKCIEEMAELTLALEHLRDGRGSREEVITEIADVLFTASQMAVLFGDDEVSAELQFKMERMEERMKNEQ